MHFGVAFDPSTPDSGVAAAKQVHDHADPTRLLDVINLRALR